ncbi:hypothetical protein Ancab_032475 [Ancistrocladus abbreviatus]
MNELANPTPIVNRPADGTMIANGKKLVPFQDSRCSSEGVGRFSKPDDVEASKSRGWEGQPALKALKQTTGSWFAATTVVVPLKDGCLHPLWQQLMLMECCSVDDAIANAVAAGFLVKIQRPNATSRKLKHGLLDGYAPKDRKTTFSLQDGLRPREVPSPGQAKAMVHLLQRITHQVQDLALEVFPETTETKETGAHWGLDGRAAWNLCTRWATNRQPPMELRWAQTSSPLSVFRGGNDVVLGLSRCSACITNPRQVQWTTAGVRMPNARV